MLYLILGLIIFILTFLLVKLLLELKHIQQQMRVKTTEESRFTITSDLSIPVLTSLCEELNTCYDTIQATKRKEQEKEEVFKDMISNIAHDIRTPLTSIQGYLQLIESEPYNADTTYFTIIHHRLDDMKNLLEEFFFYTKLLNEQSRLEMHTISLYDSCCEVLASHYPLLLEKGIEPSIDFSNQKQKVYVNKDACIHILQNLIQNAVRHGVGDLHIQQKQQTVIISNTIADTCKVDLTKIYERFYKGDASRGTTSSGLGLAIVHKLVEQNHGEIKINIEQQTFFVALTFCECKNME